jgi:hypothetical protein
MTIADNYLKRNMKKGEDGEILSCLGYEGMRKERG